MRLAALVLAFAGMGLGIAVSGCIVDRRSPAYGCEEDDDCPDACMCLDGWCMAEAGIDPGEAGLACVASRTVCDEDGVCVIDCFGYRSCEQVRCPADATECEVNCIGEESCPDSVACGDIPCTIECEGEGSCAGSISCSGDSCSVGCEARNTCAGSISCGSGSCMVECEGRASCRGDIDCSSACACIVDCSGVNTCTMAPQCPGPPSCVSAENECIADQPACDTCGDA